MRGASVAAVVLAERVERVAQLGPLLGRQPRSLFEDGFKRDRHELESASGCGPRRSANALPQPPKRERTRPDSPRPKLLNV